MFARARVALGAANVDSPATRDLTQHETIDVVGEGGTWEAAKAACVIPTDGLVLHWLREE